MFNLCLVRRLAFGFALPLLTPAAVSAGLLVDADPEWREGEHVYPVVPQDAGLRAFFVSPSTAHQFLIDVSTLSVDPDGVVRYVLVVRAAGGAESITFEGLRCATHERRIYASARKDGTWAAMKRSAWEPIRDNAANRPRSALARDLFCDGPVPPRDRAQVMRRLDGVYDYIDPSRGARP